MTASSSATEWYVTQYILLHYHVGRLHQSSGTKISYGRPPSSNACSVVEEKNSEAPSTSPYAEFYGDYSTYDKYIIIFKNYDEREPELHRGTTYDF